MNMPDTHEHSNSDTSDLVARVAHLEDVLNKILLSDKYLFQKPLIGGPNGLRLGSTAKDKVGFYNKAPLAQFASAIGEGNLTSNTGLAVKANTQWDGSTGTLGYSVGDLVKMLKNIGLIAP